MYATRELWWRGSPDQRRQARTSADHFCNGNHKRNKMSVRRMTEANRCGQPTPLKHQEKASDKSAQGYNNQFKGSDQNDLAGHFGMPQYILVDI